MLDAGHGYSTPGKRTPDGMREYEFNREAARYAREELKKYENVEVYFSHSDERDVPLTERTNKGNSLNVDAFVSIHANAFGSGGWNNAEGIETYAYSSQPSRSTALAKAIQRQMVASTKRLDRGVKFANFHVLRETTMTAVLVECGFMTNREEAALLKTDSYRKTCGQAIGRAIASYYGLTLKTTSGLYKVQVGAFKKKENADELVKQLKKAGFSPFIYFDK